MKSAATNKQTKNLPQPDIKAAENVVADNKSEAKIQSQIYRIYELKTELERGKENYEKMIPQYQAVIDTLAASGRQDEFPEGTVEQFTKDKEAIQKGLDNINYRLSMITQVLDKANPSNEAKAITEWFVTAIFHILGIGLPGSEE